MEFPSNFPNSNFTVPPGMDILDDFGTLLDLASGQNDGVNSNAW